MRIRNLMILVLTGAFIVLTLGSTAFFYEKQRMALETGIDRELLTAAFMANAVLPAHYHDGITGKDSVSDAQYLQIVDRFNIICKQTGMEYIWSLLQLDGKVEFTSATSPGKDANRGDQASFLEVHSNPELYTRTFELMQPQYQINEDKWGRIRAVLVPFYDAQGRKYLIGASRRMQEVDAGLHSLLMSSLVIGGSIILIGTLISILLANSLARPIVKLQEAAQRIAAGDYTGQLPSSSRQLSYREVNSLANSFELIRQAVRSREESYKKSETLLLANQQMTHMGGWEWDVVKKSFYWTDEVYRIHGLSPAETPHNAAELLQLSVTCYDPADRPALQAAFRDCIEKALPYDLELPFTTLAGKRLWIHTKAEAVSEQGQVVRVIGNMMDISERKRSSAEREALLEIMQGFAITKDFKEILAIIHHSVARVIYAVNFSVVFHNDATGLFEEIYAADQYDPPMPPSRLDKSITAYVYHTRQPLIMTQALFDELEARGEVEMVGTNSASWLGTPLITPNGALGVITVQNYETSDCYSENDKNFLAYIGAQVAIAYERKLAEDQISQLNVELEQRVHDRTAQLEAANQELEAFAYSVSHDLRAPLRALDGFSASLMEDYPDRLDEKGRHYLDRIQEAARRMGQLINDLLNLSRITRSEFKRQKVDLSALAAEIVADLKKQHPVRQVEVEILPGLVVDGDPHLLTIALENLLSNAFKFTGQREHAHIVFGMAAQAGQCIYFVRDNGAGFDMAYAHKLFAPFQRLHGMQEFPGTGIGLATVQRIITRHGGRIWPEAAVDQGATFYFTMASHVE
jgi:signal transduction histidine kinase